MILVTDKHARLLVALVGCVVGLLVVLPVAVASGAEGEACANAAVRVGYSALLPDCRAYEQVSPAGSPPHFENVGGRSGAFGEERGAPYTVAVAAVDGDAFGFQSTFPPAGAVGGGEGLRAVREPGRDRWGTEDVSPPQSADQSADCPNGWVPFYSPENLSRYVLADGWGQLHEKQGAFRCGRDDPLLVAGEPVGFQNLFVGESEAGSYELVDSLAQAPAGVGPADAWFEDASEDLSHVIFREAARLTEEGAGGDLYDWSAGGALQLVTRLPDGEAVQGTLAANAFEDGGIPGAQLYTHAMSGDGSRVFFQWGGNLYVRLHPEQSQSVLGEGGVCSEPAAACTLEVDSAQGGGQSGGGQFKWATPDGGKVFFLDERRLTGEATAVSGKPDLYEYDLGAPVGARLRDLTVLAGEPADVLGVSGTSSDGDHVYFVAGGSLTSVASANGALPVAGQPNLYLWHEGSITFIATLNEPVLGKDGCVSSEDVGDMEDWATYDVQRSPCDRPGSEVGTKGIAALVTASGEYLAFNSQRELTGYDNVDVKTGEHDDEIFLYQASGNSLACVSCDPSGAAAVARAQLPNTMVDTVSRIAGGNGGEDQIGVRKRSLAEDGRVFFTTAQPLLPRAKDGQENVYEYAGGVLSLLSSGTSGLGSYFFEASADGSDVFILSAQELPSASEGEYVLYDAREGGGFPLSSEAGCVEEACRGPLPSYGVGLSPASTGSGGSGNVLGVRVSSPPAGVSPPSQPKGLAAALKACRRDRSARARSVCEARARAAHRGEALREALRGCRAKHSRRLRVACEARARRSYSATASSRRRK